MPPHTLEPIIVEPKKSRRKEGRFSLFDSQFPLEVDPQYAVQVGLPLRRPHYPLGEVASWVFGKPTEWLKGQLKGAPYKRIPLRLPDGQLLVFRSVARGRTGERRFTLADIERLAWALYNRGDIDGTQLQCACQIIMAVAEQYKRHEED